MDSDDEMLLSQGITHIRGCYLFRGGFIQGTVYACVCHLCVYVCVCVCVHLCVWVDTCM